MEIILTLVQMAVGASVSWVVSKAKSGIGSHVDAFINQTKELKKTTSELVLKYNHIDLRLDKFISEFDTKILIVQDKVLQRFEQYFTRINDLTEHTNAIEINGRVLAQEIRTTCEKLDDKLEAFNALNAKIIKLEKDNERLTSSFGKVIHILNDKDMLPKKKAK
jgi:hypothetical protein